MPYARPSRRFALESFESRRLLDGGSISGLVLEDYDNDGIAEARLANVAVYLDLNGNGAFDEATEPQVFTDGVSHLPDTTPNPNFGRYTFADLAPGTYHVRVQPAHYNRVFAPASGEYIVNVAADQVITDRDFHVSRVAAVGGIIFNDVNHNGDFDDGEPLLTGVTAYLDLNNNGQLDGGEPTCISRPTISYFGQNYNFNQLDPGTYTIRIAAAPAGYDGPTPAVRVSTVGIGQETNTDHFAFTAHDAPPPPPTTAKVDFNNDGKTDIVFRSGAGSFLWVLNGAQRLLASVLQAPGAEWSLGAAADFNGDGRTDIVYHNNATGASRIWIYNGFTSTAQVDLPMLANLDWRIVGAGDFNQDGHNDIVWRNIVTGQNTLWLMNGLTVGSFRALPSTADQNWAVAGVGDFDHNGVEDIVWRHAISGRDTLWLLNAEQRISQFKALDTTADRSWVLAGVDDYDNDGDPDLFWRNAATGRSMLWVYSGTQRTAFTNVVL